MSRKSAIAILHNFPAVVARLKLGVVFKLKLLLLPVCVAAMLPVLALSATAPIVVVAGTKCR